MKIVGIGNPVYDYIKTPRVDTEDRILSGCSTNGCLAVSKLGGDAALVGCIGPDFAESLRQSLKHYSIEAHICQSEESGGFSLIYYDELGNRTLDVLGRAAPIEDLPQDVVSAADGIIIGPILGETSPELIERVCMSAQGIVLLDPQGLLRRIDEAGRVVHRRTDGLDAVIASCDIVKANEVEARIITGINPRDSEEALEQAVRTLHSLGCDIAVVTMAADGSAIFDGETYFRIPAFAVDAVDPTGAGDTYGAGFLMKYLETSDLEQAGYYGSCVASVMVENVGPDFPLTRAEADRRYTALWQKRDGQ